MNTLLLQAKQSVLLAWLLDNPLLVREIRRRMRGKLFSWSLIGYLCALGAVSIIIMITQAPPGFQDIPIREMTQRVGQIGKTIYRGMQFVEGFIALFIAPMLTAGLATAEKEKDTFDFLRVTTLNERTFVAGCLLTTAAFLVLIFSCTLPILGLTFIFGGVSMREILLFNFFIFLAAMAISAWGVFNSTSYKRSRSVQGSLVVVLFLAFFFGSKIFGVLTAQFFTPFSTAVTGTWLLGAAYVSPFVLAIVVFSVAAARRLYDPNNRLFNYKQFAAFFVIILAAIGGSVEYRMSAWSFAPLNPAQIFGYLSTYFFVGWGLLAAGMLIFSAGRIEKGDEVWRIRHTLPIFRKLPEQIPFYLALGLIWIIPSSMLGASYDPAGFGARFSEVLAPGIASLALVAAASCLMNCLTDSRNRAMIGVFLILVFAWILLPLVGFIFGQAAGGSVLFANAAAVFSAFSPFMPFITAWGENFTAGSSGGMFCAILQIIMAIGLFVPAMLPAMRERVTVSYDWWSAEGPQPGARSEV